jgi:hypothetical protein
MSRDTPRSSPAHIGRSNLETGLPPDTERTWLSDWGAISTKPLDFAGCATLFPLLIRDQFASASAEPKVARSVHMIRRGAIRRRRGKISRSAAQDRTLRGNPAHNWRTANSNDSDFTCGPTHQLAVGMSVCQSHHRVSLCRDSPRGKGLARTLKTAGIANHPREARKVSHLAVGNVNSEIAVSCCRPPLSSQITSKWPSPILISHKPV